ncbi:MAG TPA: 4-(cytidine 5'-diphospho)-2-C-methyl-D-erythritol kinase [Gemmatimonadaceae bacterium]|jgi:4-diphosphocytidyl-2-C-methyl-D-erythritol kinase|nr:4-(cytidine 5'-diphospho)-2-C-methyl-D-erythritol kinase [Gemmatimonadaceae bacterium]
MSLRGGRTLAQAKINLSLRVLAREPDGFHSIETVFLRIALGDDVRVHIRELTRTLRCGVMRDAPEQENLAYRAAELYARETGWPHGFEIVIKKRIPIGGGLGGGSADAAAVLRILNTLAEKPLSAGELCALGARIGSDVPFLVSDYAMAIGWGRGERLLQLPPLPSRDVHLFLPPFGVDTAEAYTLLDQSRGDRPSTPPEVTAEMFADWETAARHSTNDFEPVIRARWPIIDTLLQRGEQHDLFYRMSGSGSTVFKIPGITTRPSERKGPPPKLAVPKGTKRIITRTVESVVPVEILD